MNRTVTAILFAILLATSARAGKSFTSFPRDVADDFFLSEEERFLAPVKIKVPRSSLTLCSEDQNVFFILDISGSIQGKKDLRRFNNQRLYTEKALDAFGSAGSTSVRFEIAAFSRFSANVRGLRNPRSHDIDYMKRPIKSFKVFSNSKWDTPNGYNMLTKKGNRYSHIERVLKQRVDKVIEDVASDNSYSRNNTVILFTDGRPENYLYRNRQGGRYKYTDKQEFWKSLAPIVKRRDLERMMYDPSLFRVHCAMLVTGTYFANNFVNKICDTYEPVATEAEEYLRNAPIKVESCAAVPSVSPSSLPSTSPTLMTSSEPTTTPTTSPTSSPASPTPAPTTTPSLSPSRTPSTLPTHSPTLSPTVSPTAPTVSPTINPTFDGSCVLDPVDTIEDFGRFTDPGNESVVEPAQGVPFTVQCNLDDSLVANITSFDLGSIGLGEYYYNGVRVTSIPGSEFVSDGLGGYTLVGLSFLPDKDEHGYFLALHKLNTMRRDTGVGHTSTLAHPIEVCAIADIPEIYADTCVTTYEDVEAVLAIEAVVKDPDPSEVLTHLETTMLSPLAHFDSLNGENIESNPFLGETTCGTSCSNIDLSLAGAEDFSGFLELSVSGRSTEVLYPCPGKSVAMSSPVEITVRVLPVADHPILVPFSSTRSLEDERLMLAERINFANSKDQDGSEQHWLLINESSIPTGAILFLDDVPLIAEDGEFEIPMHAIPGLSIQPTPESNVDYTLQLRGKTIDTVQVINCTTGLLENYSDVMITPNLDLPIHVKGVADVPKFTNSSEAGNWTVDSSGAIPVVSRVYEEDEVLALDFTIYTGEIPLKQPDDDSEVLTVIVSIPEDFKVGNSTFVTYVGVNANGDPEFQVAAKDVGRLKLTTEDHRTADISLDARAVITENDGNSLEYPFVIKVDLKPVIDAHDYTRTIAFQDCADVAEDVMISIDILPPAFIDAQEEVSAISFTGLPDGYQVFLDGGILPSIAGIYSLTSYQISELANQTTSLEILSSLNSDVNPELIVTVTVEQSSPDGEQTASKDIQGSVFVRLRAVPETDGVLEFRASNNSAISFVAADSSNKVVLGEPRLVYETGDTSSIEDIVAVTLVFPEDMGRRYFVTGAVFDGVSRWVIMNGQYQNIEILPLSPKSGPFDIIAFAALVDRGDALEGDTSCGTAAKTSLTLDFRAGGTCLDEAGNLTVADLVIRGTEDTLVDFGNQLLITVDPTNSPNDYVSIVVPVSTLEQFPALNFPGAAVDFISGRYIFQAPVSGTGTVDVSGLWMVPPKNYAGDYEFNFTVHNFDATCGDVKSLEVSVEIELEPKVETPVAASFEVFGTPLEDEPVDIRMTIDSMTDQDPKTLGQELLEAFAAVDPILGSVTDLSVNATVGFVDIQFTPAEDYSGPVTMNLTGAIRDIALFDHRGSVERTDTAPFSETVTFDVEPACDVSTFTSPVLLDVTEFGDLSFGAIKLVPGDIDGSEEFASLAIKGVPEDFLFDSPAQNVGFNMWLYTRQAEFDDLVMRPPRFFSGTVVLTLVANLREELAEIQDICSSSANLAIDILPVANELEEAVLTEYFGNEGEDLELMLDLFVQDDTELYIGVANVVENPPETIQVFLYDVPPNATIGAGPEAILSQIDQTTWQIDTISGSLETLIFNPGLVDGTFTIKLEAKSIDNGVELAEDLRVKKDLKFVIDGTNQSPINSFPPSVPLVNSNTIVYGLAIDDIDSYGSPFRVVFTSSQPEPLAFVHSTGTAAIISATPTTLEVYGLRKDINDVLSSGLQYSSASTGIITMDTTDLADTTTGLTTSDRIFVI